LCKIVAMAKAAKSGRKPALRVVPGVQIKDKEENTTGHTQAMNDFDNVYQTAAARVGDINPANFDAAHWLGISRSKKIASYLDYIKLSNTGITKASVNILADYIGISRKYISENIFDVSVKTMERKEDKEKLNRKISSHALEIAKLVQHAYTVFRNEEKVKRWLNRENRALNNMKPVELLDTLSGLILVDDVLGRIEEGVYT
jgi:putative toxin-antitoxin system antitoxin component (TIGR02293 family)